MCPARLGRIVQAQQDKTNAIEPDKTVNTLIVIPRVDRLPEEPLTVRLNDPFEIDPTDEMFGDLDSKFEIDFNTFDRDDANFQLGS